MRNPLFPFAFLLLLSSCGGGEFDKLPAKKPGAPGTSMLKMDVVAVSHHTTMDWEWLPLDPEFLRRQKFREIIVVKTLAYATDTFYNQYHMRLDNEGKITRMFGFTLLNDSLDESKNDTLETWAYAYSGNKLHIVHRKAGSGSDDSEKWIELDGQGNVTFERMVYPEYWFTKTYTYEEGRLASVLDESKISAPLATSYSYENGYLASGSQSGVTNSPTDYSFAYNDKGQLTTRTEKGETITYKLSFTYDAAGNLSGMVYKMPLGEKWEAKLAYKDGALIDTLTVSEVRNNNPIVTTCRFYYR